MKFLRWEGIVRHKFGKVLLCSLWCCWPALFGLFCGLFPAPPGRCGGLGLPAPAPAATRQGPHGHCGKLRCPVRLVLRGGSECDSDSECCGVPVHSLGGPLYGAGPPDLDEQAIKVVPRQVCAGVRWHFWDCAAAHICPGCCIVVLIMLR